MQLSIELISKDTFLKSYPTLYYGADQKWFAVITPDGKVCALADKVFPKVNSLLKRYRRQTLLEKPLSIKEPLACLLVGTSFQHKVWQALLEIPSGKTWSYQQLAAYLQKPKAVRAVANAVGANPISPLIPCHRVIRNNGHLGGYFWGVEEKIKLLQEEGVNVAA